MDFAKKYALRIATDAAGYLLLLAALLTGWLPGPGGIPLALAGLGLLSIHNRWARRLRQYIFTNGSSLIKTLFFDNKLLQAIYDIVVSILLIIVGVIAWKHGAIWQVSLGVAIFFIALFIGLMNRDRYTWLKRLLKHKR